MSSQTKISSNAPKCAHNKYQINLKNYWSENARLSKSKLFFSSGFLTNLVTHDKSKQKQRPRKTTLNSAVVYGPFKRTTLFSLPLTFEKDPLGVDKYSDVLAMGLAICHSTFELSSGS